MAELSKVTHLRTVLLQRVMAQQSLTVFTVNKKGFFCLAIVALIERIGRLGVKHQVTHLLTYCVVCKEHCSALDVGAELMIYVRNDWYHLDSVQFNSDCCIL